MVAASQDALSGADLLGDQRRREHGRRARCGQDRSADTGEPPAYADVGKCDEQDLTVGSDPLPEPGSEATGGAEHSGSFSGPAPAPGLLPVEQARADRQKGESHLADDGPAPGRSLMPSCWLARVPSPSALPEAEGDRDRPWPHPHARGPAHAVDARQPGPRSASTPERSREPIQQAMIHCPG